MSREAKLAKNTAVLAVGTFLPKMASFITLPILTGLLTKEEYGTYDLISVLVSLVLPVATLQIQSAAFRFLIDHKGDAKKVKTIVTNIFAFILPMSLIALTILFFCLPGNLGTIKLWICAYFLADILVNAARQVTRGLANNIDYSLSAIISALGKMIFALVFVWGMRIGLTGAVIALFLASTSSLVFLIIKMSLFKYLDLRLINKNTLVELLKYSWPLVPNSMSMWVMRVSDRFVVTLFMGVGANAVYSVANKIPQLLTLAQSTFTMAWQENASIYSKDDDAPAYYSAMFKTMYNLMAGFMGALIAGTPILFKLLIRGDYDEAYYQIPVLFMGMFFYSMASYMGGIYVAYKKTQNVGITTTVAAVLNFVIDLALIKNIGLYAASISTLVSYMFLLFYRMRNVRHFVKMTYNYKQAFGILLILVIECCLCYMRKFSLDCVNLLLGICCFVIFNKEFIIAVINKLQGFLKKRG